MLKFSYLMKKLLFFILFILFILSCGFFFLPIDSAQNDTKWIFYDRNDEILFSEKPYFQEENPIPDFFKKGIIAIEDQDFYTHSGIDFSSLIRATKQNIQAQETVSGASTITMQLARLIFLENQKRNLWYKIRQSLYAIKIETKYSKEDILEEYIKKINFGTGATGLHAASNRYFSKTPKNLSIGESATLIGLIPNPSQFNPLLNPDQSEIRKDLVLDIWEKRKIISKEDKTFWQAQETKLQVKIENEIHAPHFIFWAKNKIMPILDANSKNAKEIHIHTTLDKQLYSQILNIAKNEIKENESQNNAHNASAIAIDLNTNELLAMMGSINFFDEDIDGAINMSTSNRSTGSTLKPFLYALALENGDSPADVLVDELDSFPSSEGRYMPRNFEINQEYGHVRYREALSNSYNLAAVNLLQKVGIKNFIKTLKTLHLDIGEEANLGLSAILGSGEESLLNLTTAYTIFPNNGELRTPQFLKKIVVDGTEINLEASLSGEILTGTTPDIFTPSTTDWITHSLSDNAVRWKNFNRGNALEVGRPSAVKTGTSQEFRDNWVIGYSPDIALGLWVGNARGAPLHTTSGIEGAGPLWNKIFRLLHKNIPNKNFEYISERKEIAICRRPYQQEDCSEKIIEFLLPNEIEESKINTTPPQFSIAFPNDGDIFHKDSELLLKTRNTIDKSPVQYFLDGNPIPHHIPHLEGGEHLIWAKSNNQKTPQIKIIVTH